MDPGDWQNIDPLPLPFLVMLVFWLTLLFGSFGLLAPGTFRSSPRFGLCTVAVPAGVRMIIDMTDPFLATLSEYPVPRSAQAIDIMGR